MTFSFRSLLSRGWLLVALVAAWWVASSTNPSFYFPPLPQILATFADTWFGPAFLQHALPSLLRFTVGYAIACAVGIGLGTLIGRGPGWLQRGPSWLIVFFQALPPVALIPAGLILAGPGDAMKIGLIALGAVFPILFNTLEGVQGVEPQLESMSKVYRFSKAERLFFVILPAAGPQIFAGMRTALAIGLIVMVSSEMVASTNGIGYYVLQAQQTFAIPEMWGGIILLAIIGYIVNLGFVLVQDTVLVWRGENND